MSYILLILLTLLIFSSIFAFLAYIDTLPFLSEACRERRSNYKKRKNLGK